MDKRLIEDALKQADNTKNAIFEMEKHLKRGLTQENKYFFMDNFAAMDYRFTLLRIKLNRIVDTMNADAESK